MKVKRLIAAFVAGAILMTNMDIVRAENTEEVAETVTDEVADSVGVTEYTSDDGMYTFTLDSTYNYYATLTKYLGTEKDVVVPATISYNSTSYIVESLDGTFYDNANVTSVTVSEGILNSKASFMGCSNLQKVNLPSTTASIANESFNDSINLKEVNIASGGNVYFSRDGVTYFRKDGKIHLQTFPSGKETTMFVVPNDVEYLIHASFRTTQYLSKIVVTSAECSIGLKAFNAPKNVIDIYLPYIDLDKIHHIASDAFYKLPAGSRIFVKNSTVASQITSHMEECTGTEIIDLSQSENAAYLVPATALTFTDDTTTMNKTVSVGDKVDLRSMFTITPSDTTDNVTWSSSDPKIATVNAVTGVVTTVKNGDCVITGTDESGHIITMNLKVYLGITETTLTASAQDVELNPSNPYVYAAMTVKPYNANYRDNIQWDSSDKTVATVASSGGAEYSPTGKTEDMYYENGAKITLLAPGTTTITATIDDNGTIITKSFELNVTKPIINISTCTIAPIPAQTYTGEALTPAVSVKNGSTDLVEGTDYTVEYKNNVNAGYATASITGMNDYTGTQDIRFTIAGKSLAAAVISEIPSQTATGAAIIPAVTVQLDDTTLTNGIDYTVVCTDNVIAGTATLTVTGCGNYTGSVATTFQITGTVVQPTPPVQEKQNQTIKVTSKYTKTYDNKSFTVSAKRTSGNGTLTYASSNSKVVAVSSKGKVSIKGCGTAVITVTAGETSTCNAATAKITVTVKPKRAVLTYCKSTSAKKLTVKWKKDAKATGYQIQYSTSKKFTGKTTKTATISKSKTTTKTISKLKSGKKYYVRIRAYKTTKVNGKTTKLYGSWSKTKSYSIKR